MRTVIDPTCKDQVHVIGGLLALFGADTMEHRYDEFNYYGNGVEIILPDRVHETIVRTFAELETNVVSHILDRDYFDKLYAEIILREGDIVFVIYFSDEYTDDQNASSFNGPVPDSIASFLEHNHIEKVDYSFSGSGDSGCVNDFTFFDANGDEIPVSKIRYEQSDIANITDFETFLEVSISDHTNFNNSGGEGGASISRNDDGVFAISGGFADYCHEDVQIEILFVDKNNATEQLNDVSRTLAKMSA